MRGTASVTLALRTVIVGCAFPAGAVGSGACGIGAGADGAGAAGAADGAGAMLGEGGGALGAGGGGGGTMSARPFKPRSGSVSRPRRPNISGAPFEPAGQAGHELLRQSRARLRR